MPKNPLDELIRKEVVVRANGFDYKGILIEVSGGEIILRRQTGYITIPMERVLSVVDPSKPKKPKGPARFVSSSFYQADITPPTQTEPKKKS